MFLHPNAHVRIARKVAIDMGRADLSSTLEYYSVIPDEWRNFPHHTRGRESVRIVRRVLRARNNYIHGYDNKVAAELGVAFHYIADEHVLVKGSDRRHNSYESRISRTPLNVQHLDSIEGRNATIEYINAKLGELGDRQYILTPEEALNSSYRICASVAKSVFGSKTSLELLFILIELRTAWIEKMKRKEEEFVNKLIEMAKKDEEIENSKGMRKVANRIIKTLSFFDFRFRRNIRGYKERKHLENLVKSYYKEATLTSKPYEDWYIVKTPKLSIWTKEVKPKLLTVESVAKAFNLDEQRIKELKKETKIPTLMLKDAEFIKKENVPEIAAYLNMSNPFAEPPAGEHMRSYMVRQLLRKALPRSLTIRQGFSPAIFNEIAAKKLFERYKWIPTDIPLSELKSIMPSGIVSVNAESVGISDALKNLIERRKDKFVVVGQRLLLLAKEVYGKYLATVDLKSKVFACNCPLYNGEMPCKHFLFIIYHYHDSLLKLYASHEEAEVWRKAFVKAQQHADSQAMLCNWLYYFAKEFVSHLNFMAGRYKDVKAVERLAALLEDSHLLGAPKMTSLTNSTIKNAVANSSRIEEA